MIALWKEKNPIYFGVITIIPFDNLYRRAYFVMHTFLVIHEMSFLLFSVIYRSALGVYNLKLKSTSKKCLGQHLKNDLIEKSSTNKSKIVFVFVCMYIALHQQS
jgi:hypothetical protein